MISYHLLKKRFSMKCENCGAKIKKRETYCPKCGMELFNSQYKPLKKKYLRGEYMEREEVATSTYDLEDDDYSESTYQQDKYQNQNYNQDEDYNYNRDRKGKQYKQYNENKDYNQKRKKNYQRNYNQKTNPQKKYQRGYDLDEYYESEESGSSIWGTIFLLLIVALLFGFVMGFMFFSTKI